MVTRLAYISWTTATYNDLIVIIGCQGNDAHICKGAVLATGDIAAFSEAASVARTVLDSLPDQAAVTDVGAFDL
jgi:hypothetical protein